MIPGINCEFDFARLARDIHGPPWPGDADAVVTSARVHHGQALKDLFGDDLATHDKSEFVLGEIDIGENLVAERAVSHVQLRQGRKTVAAEAVAVASDLAYLHGGPTRTRPGASLLPPHVALAHSLRHSVVGRGAGVGEYRSAAHVRVHLRFHGIAELRSQIPQVDPHT